MPTEIDLKKLVGIMPEPVSTDVQISIEYVSGKCKLDAWIKAEDFKRSCKLALDLIEMGFWIESVEMRRVKANKSISVDEFARLYNQAAKLRG